MSGNPVFDQQIADSVSAMQRQSPQQTPQMMGMPPPQMAQSMFQMPTQIPQQATQQNFSWQRPVLNPVFGGSIPMNFGLPEASQIPASFKPRQFTPSQSPAPAPVNTGGFSFGGDMGYIPGNFSGGNQND